jgi:heme-degrading monooxygenase HmoA
MAIRVVIERQAIPGNELELNRLLMELRSKAMHSKGYISGETLRSLEDPNSFIVLSTWDSIENWKVWSMNDERKEIQTKIDALLRTPSTQRVYAHY